jgi:hypothetical protein
MLTLLVNSQPLISKAMGVSFSRGMYLAALDIKRHMQDCFSGHF